MHNPLLFRTLISLSVLFQTYSLLDLFLSIWYFFDGDCFEEIGSREREEKFLLGFYIYFTLLRNFPKLSKHSRAKL